MALAVAAHNVICDRGAMVEKAKQLFFGMKDRGISPDVSSFYLSTSRFLCYMGDLEEAKGLFCEMGDGRARLNVVAFNFSIDAFCTGLSDV
ncbi:hypothetical protein SLEP1_g32369 [Rubroshorea leprosula]|uniref:Pentatricopeptide repeat-containing protein n=1 Tax=Rubroshorea leprosula TaxID=152421 RepID=A0AAV5KDA1_9ROSI|nr:hypothetical protein SLEP1_g32369 [Rubroshorea leprosula]